MSWALQWMLARRIRFSFRATRLRLSRSRSQTRLSKRTTVRALPTTSSADPSTSTTRRRTRRRRATRRSHRASWPRSRATATSSCAASCHRTSARACCGSESRPRSSRRASTPSTGRPGRLALPVRRSRHPTAATIRYRSRVPTRVGPRSSAAAACCAPSSISCTAVRGAGPLAQALALALALAPALALTLALAPALAPALALALALAPALAPTRCGRVGLGARRSGGARMDPRALPRGAGRPLGPTAGRVAHRRRPPRTRRARLRGSAAVADSDTARRWRHRATARLAPCRRAIAARRRSHLPTGDCARRAARAWLRGGGGGDGPGERPAPQTETDRQTDRQTDNLVERHIASS